MYEWLPDALQDKSEVVTANRRLARVLVSHYGDTQVARGETSWLTPAIYSWSDWVNLQLDKASIDVELPTRLNRQQSELLWEQCIRRELEEPPVNVNGLVRLAMDAWNRLQDWNVPAAEFRSSAWSADQKLFAASTARYRRILRTNNWVDETGRTALLRQLITDERLALPARLSLAGFDRIAPAVLALLDGAAQRGVQVTVLQPSLPARVTSVLGFENADAEMRAAGAWARTRLSSEPDLRLAIVTPKLDQDAERLRRLVLEGFVPGWQFGDAAQGSALNVSYGRKLSDFPAIAIAMLALRWLTTDLGARDVSLLLRSPVIASATTSGRARLELKLRELPDRSWSPALLRRALRAAENETDAGEFMTRVALIAARRKTMPRTATPSRWAEWIDEYLRALGWPGEQALDSHEFQLVNRWRDLLNDFARLELVRKTMPFGMALGRLAAMATSTVFQAEAEGAVLELIGPLEAAGLEFDELWIGGLAASNWPPIGRPSPFLSRRLQRDFGMPDADPADTAEYARRVLDRLRASATSPICSYPRTDGDAEQTPTTLLGDVSDAEQGDLSDPGWNASSLLTWRTLGAALADAVPAVVPGELVSGGAATIQKQLSNPFAAFVAGRLGVRYMPLITAGLAANLRGNLIHDALHALYEALPTRATIVAWDAAYRQEKIDAAVDRAFQRHERHADVVLRQLFALERERVASLVDRVVSLDCERDDFTIAGVEGKTEAEINGVHLSLRYDRLDRVADGELAVLDYKTGAFKKFLQSNGQPRDFQLVVYACTLPKDVAGLGLVNIDSRGVVIDGAGAPFGDATDWHRHLGGWKAEVRNAADAISRGDVRINAHQGISDARPLALLSRFVELRRDT